MEDSVDERDLQLGYLPFVTTGLPEQPIHQSKECANSAELRAVSYQTDPALEGWSV